MEKFPPIEGWKPYYHHMTICLDELPEVATGYFLKKVGVGAYLICRSLPPRRDALDKEVTLTVVAVGKSDKAYAVQVEGEEVVVVGIVVVDIIVLVNVRRVRVGEANL